MTKPVFDFAAGKPWIINEAMEATMHETIEEEGPRFATEALRAEEVRQLRRDPDLRAQLRDAYDEAGINLPSVTMSGRDPTKHFLGPESVQRALSQWHARIDAIDWLNKVTSPAEARAVADRDEVGVIINVQDLGTAIDGDIDNIEHLYNQGVRLMQLTYNRQNILGTGCTDRSDGGLSYWGLDAIERLNELGAVVDLSHCGKQTTLDAIEQSDEPVAFTHTFCAEVADHDRAKSDEELKALAENDGYMGIVALRFFLAAGMAEQTSIDIFFDHLEHAVDILGVDRVGLGSDFGEGHDVDYPDELQTGVSEEAGWRPEHGVDNPSHFDEVKHYSDLHVIRDGLEDRFTENEVDKILGENFLSFWERIQ
ncbi:MAG: dipeptidase [Halobacteriales archaeon]